MPTAWRICGRRALRRDTALQRTSMSLRLVLDTNIWLDWLVFDDAGVAPLKAAVAHGNAEIYINAACEEELLRVLGYSLRKRVLDDSARAARIAEYRRIAHMLEPGECDDAKSRPPLPACRDPDDQKFLELARDCAAGFLVTKDRELLRLSRRNPPFRIVTPAQINWS